MILSFLLMSSELSNGAYDGAFVWNYLMVFHKKAPLQVFDRTRNMPLDIEKVIKSSPAVQKQPSEMFYKKNFLKNFAMLPQPATILKKRILQNFLEYIFYRTPSDDCFWQYLVWLTYCNAFMIAKSNNSVKTETRNCNFALHP